MATPKRSFMKLDETPQEFVWPETHYAFIEKIGPFQETAPQAWQAIHERIPMIAERHKIIGYMSLYKVEPKVYRAGVALDAAPADLPEGVQYAYFKGGKYVRFVLTGAYSNLPEACGRVFLIVADNKIPQRDDFCIENYVNDPRTTPEDQLITEILIPTA